MYAPRPIEVEPDSETYALGEERLKNSTAAALVALHHTPLERQLYEAMLSSIDGFEAPASSFSARRIMEITNINNLSTIRRGMGGLVAKFSAERQIKPNSNGVRQHVIAYRVLDPEEVLTRRAQNGLLPDHGVAPRVGKVSFDRAIRRVTETGNLSRREAQVALCCIEGLTNAQIGSRLSITEQTVKFHLRNIFVKYGVRRRAELISRLLM